MNDIISLDDNKMLTFAILKKACELTSSSNTTVYFLIAGGRKTMSSCLSLAAQLYGRPQDRIYHILVSPEFESCREFFYPPPKSTPIRLLDEKKQPYIKESRYAQLTLINMPFISIRENLPKNLLKNLYNIEQLAPYFIIDDPCKLVLRPNECTISIGEQCVKLMPASMALYTFFALKKLNCNMHSCSDCSECFMDVQQVMEANQEIVALYDQIMRAKKRYIELNSNGIYELSKDDFMSYKSKIRHELMKVFGQASVDRFSISSVGVRPNTRYGIRMDRNAIVIEE